MLELDIPRQPKISKADVDISKIIDIAKIVEVTHNNSTASTF